MEAEGLIKRVVFSSDVTGVAVEKGHCVRRRQMESLEKGSRHLWPPASDFFNIKAVLVLVGTVKVTQILLALPAL